MSKLMEDRLNERAVQTAVQIAVNLLTMGNLSHDKIAKATGLSLSDIEDIARQLNAERSNNS